MLIQLSGIYIAALLTLGFRERMLVRFGCCFSFQQSLLKPANCTVLLMSYLALVAPGAFKFSTMLLPSLQLSRRVFPVDCYSPHIHGPPLHILTTSPTHTLLDFSHNRHRYNTTAMRPLQVCLQFYSQKQDSLTSQHLPTSSKHPSRDTYQHPVSANFHFKDLKTKVSQQGYSTPCLSATVSKVSF